MAERGNQLDYSEERTPSTWKRLFPSGLAGCHPHLTNLSIRVTVCRTDPELRSLQCSYNKMYL